MYSHFYSIDLYAYPENTTLFRLLRPYGKCLNWTVQIFPNFFLNKITWLSFSVSGKALFDGDRIKYIHQLGREMIAISTILSVSIHEHEMSLLLLKASLIFVFVVFSITLELLKLSIDLSEVIVKEPFS